MELDQQSSNRNWIPHFNIDSTNSLLDEDELRKNLKLIDADLEHFKIIFVTRLEKLASERFTPPEWASLDANSGSYAALANTLSFAERLLLLISIIPHYAPEILKELIAPVQRGLAIEHPQIGGYINHVSFQFVPNFQTVMFLVAGNDKTSQQLCYRELVFNGSLLKRQVITLNTPSYAEPIRSDKELIPELAEEYVQYILQGRQPRPDFGLNFPAKLHTTDKSWEQLVLNPFTAKEIELLMDWVEHGSIVAEESKGYFGPGFPALFFGPPGTGKSMTAALIGKRCGLNVFRVDASRIVSKYIGETEKNITQLFQRMKVENERNEKKAILFFDEADVLFSKRTEVKDAKDKWANLETSVLLPLVEEYDGLVIVATNLENNLDAAMTRRFQLKIKFPLPKYSERLIVWNRGLPPKFAYPNPSIPKQFARYNLSQASIINILKGGCIQAKKRGTYILAEEDLQYHLQSEFAKSGLTPSLENIPFEQ